MNKILCLIISLIPFQIIKSFFFKSIGYKLNNSKILFFVIFKNTNVEINNSTIKSFNIILYYKININNTIISNFNYVKNLSCLIITNSKLKKFNRVTSGTKNKTKNNTLDINNSEIGDSNYLDASTDILIYQSKINDCCQIWTHEFDVLRKIKYGKVLIKNNVVVNNFVIILPNVEIQNNICIYQSTIVHKSINESGNYHSILVSK